MVAQSPDPEAALSRIQAAMLAHALGGRGREETQRRADALGPVASALLHRFAELDVALVPAIADPDKLGRFYELLQGRLRPAERRSLGQYFTPRPIVRAMWSLALEALSTQGAKVHSLRVIDPALGSGAFFLEALRRQLDGPQLLGIEILQSAAATAVVNTSVAAHHAHRGMPQVLHADAYAPESEAEMIAHARMGEQVLVIGNPPYNGKSALLSQPERLQGVRDRLLPFAAYHAPHSGFRDDFVFFLGLAHRVVARSGRPGVICFILPSAMLDARDHRGLRTFLTEHYQVQIVEVGASAFPDARVATSIVVLSTESRGARYTSLGEGAAREQTLARLASEPALASLGEALPAEKPDAVLRPVQRLAALHRDTDPITDVLQRWFTPHKTGFEELLVDADAHLIWERLVALRADGFTLQKFAAKFGPSFKSERVQKKLLRVREFAREQAQFPIRGRLSPYLRYNPGRARFAAPADQWQHCYFEPKIATLFNHAFKGTLGRFHPHDEKPQLLFNTFESPLYAMVVDRPGVLHLFQHARFAPLHVPKGCYDARDSGARSRQDAGEKVLNLTPAWRERAALLRSPDDVFHLLTGIIQSALMQRRFGPDWGKREAVPVRRFDRALAKVAQRVADRARLLAALEARDADTAVVQAALDLDVVRLYLGADLPEAEVRSSVLGQACLV